MNPRRLFAVITVLSGLTSPIWGQSAAVPYQGFAPVMINNNFAGADPYAPVIAQPNQWWWGNGLALPTPQSMRNRFWYRAEYLRWGTEGFDLPALVTTSPSGTPQNQAAVLGEPGTGVLFGAGEINDGSTNGLRLRSGFWMRQRDVAFESEFFQLSSQNDGFSASSDGTTILGRPLFDIVNGQETANLISYPGLVSGSIGIGSRSKLKSYLFNVRAGLLPNQGVAFDGCGTEQSDRVDWIVGYRYIELEDGLSFAENLTSLVPTAPGTVAISEGFQTRNRFSGLQLGVLYQANFRRAWLESLLRVAIGNNKQTINISGSTAITEAGVTNNFVGGLLAQRTNIGDYQRDQFVMIPEVGLTLGVRLSDRWRATIGYTVLYFPTVVRPGDQIDTDVNPNLIPPETVPFTGALRPRFRYVESDYWAQGLNLGAQFQF